MHISIPNGKTRRLACVAPFFNYFHSKARIRAYHQFKEKMARSNVFLLTVESAYRGEPFNLRPAEDVLHVRTNSIMMHRSNLINLGAMEAIRRGYEKIVWVDADTVFYDDHWGDVIADALDVYPLLHCASTINNQSAFVKALCLNEDDNGLWDGGAYAARKEFFLDCGGTWPYSILEGNNKQTIHGPLSLKFPAYERMASLHPYFREVLPQCAVLREQFDRYQAKVTAYAGDGIFYTKLDMHAFPHEVPTVQKQCHSRYHLYLRYQFNPLEDIVLNRDEVYEFSGTKPRLAFDVYNYLKLREVGTEDCH